jgi:hypothetical protein
VHNLDEQDLSRKRRFDIEWMKLWSLGSMGPPLRLTNCHNHHSKSILSVTKWRRFIPWLRGGPAASRGSTAPPNRHTTKTVARNQPSTASGARIRSVQVKRQWIIGPAAPPHPATPMKMGPHPQPTSLTYKRSLTPAGSHTPRRSITFQLFTSLRVGLV